MADKYLAIDDYGQPFFGAGTGLQMLADAISSDLLDAQSSIRELARLSEDGALAERAQQAQARALCNGLAMVAYAIENHSAL